MCTLSQQMIITHNCPHAMYIIYFSEWVPVLAPLVSVCGVHYHAV